MDIEQLQARKEELEAEIERLESMAWLTEAEELDILHAYADLNDIKDAIYADVEVRR